MLRSADILRLTGVAYELKDLGKLDSDIALYSDGFFEVLPDTPEMTYIPARAYSYRYAPSLILGETEEVKNCWIRVILKYRPVLDLIAERVSKISPPSKGEVKIIPVLYLLGGKGLSFIS